MEEFKGEKMRRMFLIKLAMVAGISFLQFSVLTHADELCPVDGLIRERH